MERHTLFFLVVHVVGMYLVNGDMAIVKWPKSKRKSFYDTMKDTWA